MAVSGVSGTAVAAVAGGGVLVWSGLKGIGVSASLRNLIAGKAPPAATGSEAIGTPSGAAAAAAAGGSAAVAPSGPGETAFWTAVLLSIGAPPTRANISSLAAWNNHEEPSWGAGNANNPLNTSQGGGIGPYPTAAAGVAATASTLTNGRYPGIVAALRSGKGLCGSPGLGAEFSTWSGGGYSSVC